MRNRDMIYLDGLGYRHPVDDYTQIEWWLRSYTKKLHKAHATRYWMDLLKYKDKLLKLSAFELLQLIKDHVSEKQIERREAYRVKAKVEAMLAETKMEQELRSARAIHDLIRQIRLN